MIYIITITALILWNLSQQSKISNLIKITDIHLDCLKASSEMMEKNKEMILHNTDSIIKVCETLKK